MVTSITTKDNTDIPDNIIEWWDAPVAQDQSVIAYIEDDGSGGYKVTIGGRGGIIANQNCSSLFRDFSNTQTIDLTYLDTSYVINMRAMFNSCSNLTSLNVSYFDTSSVTNMEYMFFSCSNLKTIDMRAAVFNATSYSQMFSQTANLSVIVKDETARVWIQDKLDIANSSNSVAVIERA